MKTSALINLLGLLLLLTITSCRLDGETLVEGQLVDRHTGQPVGNGHVVIFSASSGGYSSSYGYLTEKKTDANGKFGFTFDGSGDMVLRGFTEKGHYTTWEDAIDLKGRRNNKDLKVKVQAPAFVKVKLVNVPPLNTSPYIYVWGFSPDEKAQIGVEFPYIKNDTSFVRVIGANRSRTIAWRIRADDGTDTQYGQEVVGGSLDTVNLVIQY